MNYIELIRNFWKVFRQNEFGSLEIGLYFHLIEFANSLNWPKSFKLPNSNIIETLDCSASKLHRARKNLVAAGIIKYDSGSKSNPGIYAIQSATYPLSNSDQSAINRESIRTQSKSSSVEEVNTIGESDRESICYQSVNDEQATCDQSANRSLNKTKLNKTKQENTLSPNGETKTLFSNPRGERTEDCPLRIEAFEAERETALHSVTMDKSIEPVSSEKSPAHEALPSGEENTLSPGKGELALRLDQKEIVGIPAIEQTEEETLECVEYNSCSKFERDVMETWEVLIGPFENHWVPLLRETLTKCYPSQVKNAIIAIDRSKHEVLMERGFEYLMQPLLNGTFGRRVKKNGRNDWHGSGSFRDPIEKFKNPAKEKPKTREELLKYTTY